MFGLLRVQPTSCPNRPRTEIRSFLNRRGKESLEGGAPGGRAFLPAPGRVRINKNARSENATSPLPRRCQVWKAPDWFGEGEAGLMESWH